MNYLIIRVKHRPKFDVVKHNSILGVAVLQLSKADTLLYSIKGLCVVEDAYQWNRSFVYSVGQLMKHHTVVSPNDIPFQDDLL